MPLVYLANEAAAHAAKLRVELSQSRSEQREYLKNVELARVLDKRRKLKGDVPELRKDNSRFRPKKQKLSEISDNRPQKTETALTASPSLSHVLNSIF